MIYNGFVITDTYGIDNPNAKLEMVGEDGFNSYHEESGDYSVPAGPAGGGSTPPTLPAGWSVTGAGAPSSSGGGSGDGGGGSWQQWVNPQTIGATVGMIGSVAGAVGAGRSPDKARIKAVCGRKPLFNIKGKKDAYNQCVQNLMMPQQKIEMPPPGMSQGTKILIGVMAFVLLLAIIITIVVLMKRQNTTATA